MITIISLPGVHFTSLRMWRYRFESVHTMATSLKHSRCYSLTRAIDLQQRT